jgi:hypothetical protein
MSCSVRSETWQQNPGKSDFAPPELRIKKRPLGYKHLAPLGEAAKEMLRSMNISPLYRSSGAKSTVALQSRILKLQSLNFRYASKRKERVRLLQRRRRCRLDQLLRRACLRCRHQCPGFSCRVLDSRAFINTIVAVDKENWGCLISYL